MLWGTFENTHWLRQAVLAVIDSTAVLIVLHTLAFLAIAHFEKHFL